jgi:hypothetical protein
MARIIGDVAVTIYPDTSRFLADLTTKIKAIVAGYKAPEVTVPVAADTRPAETAITALLARMKTAAGQLAQLRVDADTKAAEAKITALQAKMQLLIRQVGTMLVKADTTELDAKIAAEMANLASLRRQASELQLNADDAAAVAKIAGLKKQIRDLSVSLEDLTAEVDITAALTKLHALDAQLKVLRSDARIIEIEAKTGALNAAIIASEAKIGALQKEAADVRLGGIDPVKLAAATAGVTALEASMAKLNDTGKKVSGAVITGGGFWGLGGQIAGIGTWHIVLDAVIEAVIALAGALIAFAAGAAAVAEPVRNIATHLNAVRTVSSALGTDIPPLTGKFDALSKAMAPRAVEGFGGALAIVRGQSGQLLSTMEPVVNLFDDWIAKIDIWAGRQRTFGGLVTAGTGYLAQFGQIIGHLTEAITNLLAKEPGIAGMLLSVADGAVRLIDAFSRLPAPIVEATLALHGLYLWTKVLFVAPVLAMARSLGYLSDAQLATVKSGLGLQSIFKFLLTNPYGWAIDAAAALAYLAYQTTQADTATKNFTAGLERTLSAMSASEAATTGLAEAIGSVRDRMDTGALMAREQANWSKLGSTLRSAGYDAKATVDDFGRAAREIFYSSDILGGLKDLGKGMVDAIKPGGGAALAVQNDISLLNGELNKLTGSYRNLFTEAGSLVRSGYSVQQSFALMDLAGVKWNDSLELQQQKVKNLIDGYKAMSITGGLLANSVNAVTFASLQQQEKVQQLNQAWDTFFQTVTGGESAFTSFASQAIGLYQSLGDVTDRLTISNGRVSLSIRNTAAAGQAQTATMTGLNAASIQAREAFLKTADAANTQMDSLTLLANAAGLGAKGTGMLAQATRDMVAQLLPAARGSQVMTDVLYALAQRGGYRGADSFQALAKWVGNTRDPMKSLDGIVTTLTTDAAGLTQDVKNLSQALGTTLNQAMSTAIFTASGGQQIFDDFAKAVLASHGNIAAMEPSALALAKGLLTMTGNVSDAKAEFETFARAGLGLGKDAADALWKSISGQLTPAIAMSGAQAQQAAAKIDSTLVASLRKIGFDLGPKAVDDLKKFTAEVLANGAGSDRTRPSRDQLIRDLEQAGLTADQARAYVKTLQGQIDALHGKTVGVGVTATGSGGVHFFEQGVINKTFQLERLKAAGGYISGGTGPTADDVPIWASKGEYVVKAASVQKYGQHMMDTINAGRFAGGGLVDLVPSAASASAYAASDAAETALRGTYAAALAATRQQAMKTLASAAGLGNLPLGPAGPLSSSAAAAQAFARSIMFAYGWTQVQWPPLQALWTRESGWNAYAQNPSSGAAGIPQNIQGWTAYRPGDYQAQIRWGLAYISARYGSPAAAWAHEVANNWYKSGGMVADRGAVLRPGPNLLVNRTGALERLVPAGHHDPAPPTELHVHLHNHGVIGNQAQLQDWLVRGIDQAARQGRLTYALRRSPSA